MEVCAERFRAFGSQAGRRSRSLRPNLPVAASSSNAQVEDASGTDAETTAMPIGPCSPETSAGFTVVRAGRQVACNLDSPTADRISLCRAGISALSAKFAGPDQKPTFPIIPENIKIVTDYNAVNVVKSTLAPLQYRECGTRCHTALKALAVGR